jgi:hypothetical protein
MKWKKSILFQFSKAVTIIFLHFSCVYEIESSERGKKSENKSLKSSLSASKKSQRFSLLLF